MRAFNQNDIKSLLAAFGESLELSTGVSITVLHEQEQVVFEEMVSTEKYFTCALNDISTTDTFILGDKTYQVRKIVNDFSGIVNVYYEARQ
ncbi:Uncharacterised protein [Yersinia rohdei]|uniref:Phage protein n=1 Tax=Yersinia rohdei TaxID=29485 RepID=A0A0U1HUS9_YERRO|nr:hypothetical protein [Yersinia rohdei]CQI92578.1 Uncharacterised protein [Yersinia rohdei]